ncbi:hypothetical protein ASG49_10395 [Marmoricola sp. Leaf446]|uniref:SLC13 family permease n=1 Tax=Marmoricola sp. Leaf446 TaxID=1736379 RepID=UPI0006F9B106|nr:SLC13 family permease [Marmoricola sp. Leaf446]KQT92380.1 hypothetical protein ASG49_10395 [Marmoricola sp. Leaf446]
MSAAVLSIVVLAVIFVVATFRSVNMGVLALFAAFAVGLGAADMSQADVLAGFPSDIFLILVGLTFMFGFAQQNGTIDWIVAAGLRLVRGRVAAAPWIFFVLTAALISVGALFAVAIVAPLAIPFARRYAINQLMMGLMVVHGALAGAFSPISVYGSFIAGYLRGEDLPISPLALFLGPFVFNVVVGVLVYVFMGGRALLGRRVDTEAPAAPDGSADGAPAPGPQRLGAYQALTLAGLLLLAALSVATDLDTGVVAISIGALFALLAPADSKRALDGVSWSVMMLICGILTYINVLETAGAVDYVSEAITSIGAPLLAVLLLCYLAGVTSAVASSLGIIGVAIALAVPFLEQGSVSPIAFTVALAVAATVVDVSPFSTNGALVLANVPEVDRDAMYRRMLGYAGVVVAAGPGLAWLTFLVPASLG